MSNLCWLGLGLLCLAIGVVVVLLALLVWLIVWWLKPRRAAEPAEQVVEVQARPAAPAEAAALAELPAQPVGLESAPAAAQGPAPAEREQPPQRVLHEAVMPFAPEAQELRLYHDYSRQEVHDIFAPGTPFTPQAGTWGLLGIVKIPDRDGDFVFFVTFGQEQGDHVFREWISEDGVLSWQSQPKQSLADEQIQQFIHHDERRNHIHLFLRTRQGVDYAYLGELKYLWHDPSRERPVWFRWQLLSWPIPPPVRQRMGLRLRRK